MRAHISRTKLNCIKLVVTIGFAGLCGTALRADECPPNACDDTGQKVHS